MKINKDSWHYRCAQAFTDGDVSTNLCNYFWQVMGPILYVLFILLFGVAALVSFAFEYGWALLWLIPLVLVGCAIFVAVIVGALTLWETLSERYAWSFERKSKPAKKVKEKKPNIFVEWLKAKKTKICPIIEFEEEA